MLRDCLDKVLGLTAIGAWAAAAVAAEEGGAIATLAEPVSGGVMLASSLAIQLRKSGRDACAAALDKARREVERETLSAMDGHVEHRAEIDALFSELGGHLTAISPTVSELVTEWRLDPEMIASKLVGRLVAGSDRIASSHVARQVVEAAIVRAVAALNDDPELFRKLEPAVAREVLSDLGWLKETVARIYDTTSRIEKRVEDGAVRNEENFERLIALLEKRGFVARAEKEGLERRAILALARQLKPDELLDIDQAISELERAVRIALEVLARGHAPSNHDGLVVEVRRRVAERTEAGQLDEASAEVDSALAELDRREADQAEALKRSRIELIEAGIAQDMLRRDTVAVARRVAELAALETPDPSARFAALRAAQDEWYVRGRDHGQKLDLEASVEIARLTVARAPTSPARGAAQNDLGIALWTLGERVGGEPGEALLTEAIAVYGAALEVFTRDTMPNDWALTRMNRANAFLRLGERVGGAAGVAFLKAAVDGCAAAMEVYTRDTMPAHWATAQMNRANALQGLGGRAGGASGAASLKEAVAGYDAALEVYARDTMPADWAMTQMNRANALLSLGELVGGTAGDVFLKEAVYGYDAALQVCAREAMPAQWAMTQMNRANALRALGKQAGGPAGEALLKEAVTGYDAALEVRTRDTMPAYWAMTQANRAMALHAHVGWVGGEAREAFLKEAVAGYDAALEVFSEPGMEYHAETTRQFRTHALAELKNLSGGG